MKQTDYLTFVNSDEARDLGPFSTAADVERAVALLQGIEHWFDRQRAISYIAKRVEVDSDLICRMMTRKRGPIA